MVVLLAACAVLGSYMGGHGSPVAQAIHVHALQQQHLLVGLAYQCSSNQRTLWAAVTASREGLAAWIAVSVPRAALGAKGLDQ